MDDQFIAAIKDENNGLQQPVSIIKAEPEFALWILVIERLYP
ncbi:hypothetical protein [Trueperella pyogenes]|nr:hypothetical protein [Trueperella pyogenes]